VPAGSLASEVLAGTVLQDDWADFRSAASVLVHSQLSFSG
jgi:hypothetical protein